MKNLKKEFIKEFWSKATMHTNEDVDEMWAWIEQKIKEAKIEENQYFIDGYENGTIKESFTEPHYNRIKELEQ